MSGFADVADADVQLLLFEVGGATLGADATQVLRIDRPSSDAVVLPDLLPRTSGRALVFRRDGGDEAQLRVDAIRGVVNVAVDSLRRLPAVARTQSYAIGLWLGEERPVLLIDLQETPRAS